MKLVIYRNHSAFLNCRKSSVSLGCHVRLGGAARPVLVPPGQVQPHICLGAPYSTAACSSLLLPLTLALCAGLSVGLGHTALDWPSISDIASSPPESCIFSQLANLEAALLAATFYIRYKQASIRYNYDSKAIVH